MQTVNVWSAAELQQEISKTGTVCENVSVNKGEGVVKDKPPLHAAVGNAQSQGV
jgi:hypothetical protein